MAAAISVWVISIIILLLAARKCDKRTNMQDDFEAMKEDIAMLKALNTIDTDIKQIPEGTNEDIQKPLYSKVASRHNVELEEEESLNDVLRKIDPEPINLDEPTKHTDGYVKHNAYGIRKWLKMKELCLDKNGDIDYPMYKLLIIEFCDSKGFDHSLKKEFHSYESFTQNRFKDFSEFAIDKFSKKK